MKKIYTIEFTKQCVNMNTNKLDEIIRTYVKEHNTNGNLNECKCGGSIDGYNCHQKIISFTIKTHKPEHHVCSYCGDTGYKHSENECLKKCKCNYTHQHTVENHLCRICFNFGHLPKDCLLKCQCGRENPHAATRHKCRLCDKVGSIHPYEKCPEKCPCGEYPYYHNKENHKCKHCRKRGFEHLSKDCPLLNEPTYDTVSNILFE